MPVVSAVMKSVKCIGMCSSYQYIANDLPFEGCFKVRNIEQMCANFFALQPLPAASYKALSNCH